MVSHMALHYEDDEQYDSRMGYKKNTTGGKE
jgi:hypothetical protein